MSKSSGRLFIVATPIGNLDDVSQRAVQVLKDADLILAEDTRHSARLLARFGIRTRVSAFHEHNERRAVNAVMEKLEAGLDAALICDAGTPLISDPGYPLVRAAHERGVAVVPVPGPSAVLAALSVSGLPTDRFTFEGFLPPRSEARRRRLETLAAATGTLVFLESTHRVQETVEDMAEIFGPGRTATLAKELTKVHETVRRDSLSELAAWLSERAERRKGEFVLVVAGADAPGKDTPCAADRALLEALLEELPVKAAVRVAARVSASRRNDLYTLALELTGGLEDEA